MSRIEKASWEEIAAEIAQWLQPMEGYQSVYNETDWQQEFMQALVDGLGDLEGRLAEVIFRYLNGAINVQQLAGVLSEMQAGDMGAWEKLDSVLQSMDLDQIEDLYRSVYEDTSLKVAEAIRTQAASFSRPRQVELTFRFNLVNPKAQEWARLRAGDLVKRTNYQMRQDLRQLVWEAVGGDMTPMQAARRIAPVVGLLPSHRKAVQRFRAATAGTLGPSRSAAAATRYAKRLLAVRARMVARTEIMAAQNAGQLGLWQHKVKIRQLPGSVQKLWIVTRDDKLCPRCQQMKGDRAFAPLDGYWLCPGPRRSSGDIQIYHPPMHPNCRCTHGLFMPGFLTEEQTKAVLVGTDGESVTPIEKLRRELGEATWQVLERTGA